jgi:hypothetical protein
MVAFAMPFDVSGKMDHYTVQLCWDKAWLISARCVSGHGVQWSPDEALKTFPPTATLGAIAARLVCAKCDAREGTVAIWQDHGEQQRRDVAAYEAGKGKPED